MSGNGQLTGATSIPTRIASDLDFALVYAGPTSCALTPDGRAYCWGVNDYGVGGDGTTPRAGPEIATPSPVTGDRRFASLGLGESHVCGLTTDADAYCWGFNGAGQLGDNSTQHHSTPTIVAGGLRWRLLSAGGAHTCGISTDDGLYCWGSNADGQFGNGQKGQAASTPQLIEKPTRFANVAAGYTSTCGLTTDGAAFCWGRGQLGQLGNGVKVGSSVPVPVSSPR